jgi:hypothetical protein
MPTGSPGIRQRRLFEGWGEACRVIWGKAIIFFTILRILFEDCAELLLKQGSIQLPQNNLEPLQ